MYMYSVLPALIAVYSLFIGISIFVRAEKKAIYQLFSLFCLAAFIWHGAWAVLFQIESASLANVLVKVGYLFIVFIPSFVYHYLILSSNEPRFYEKWLVWISYIISFIFVCLLPSELFISGYYQYSWGYYPKAGPFHYLHIIHMAIALYAGIFSILRSYKYEKNENLRERYLYLGFGVFIYSFAGIDYFCNYGFDFYPPGVIFGFLSMNIIAMSILKYELFDLKLAVTKMTSYIFTLLVFSTTFLFIDFGVQYRGYDVPYIPRIIYFLYVVMSCALFNKVREVIQQPIEKRFLKGYYDIQKLILDLSSELILSNNQIDILKIISKKLKHELEISESYFIFSHLHESKYKLYHYDYEKSLFSIDDAIEFESVFFNRTQPIILKNLSNNIKQIVGPLPISEKSLIIPIHSLEKLHGVLVLGEKKDGKSYFELDIAMIQAMINQLMIVFDRILYHEKLKKLNNELQVRVAEQVKEIEEKRIMEKDLEVASKIQQQVLPSRVPQLLGYNMSVGFYPARIVSGDYYTFLVFSEYEIGIFIADIVGKGIPAAFQMMALNTLVHDTIRSTHSPKEACELLHLAIRSSNVIKSYVPVIYAKLNVRTNTFVYTNAGHEYGLYRSEKGVSLLDVGGPPLGMDDDAVFEEQVLELSDQDKIVLFTDGLLDVRNEHGEGFGVERVQDVLNSHVIKNVHYILEKKWRQFLDSKRPQKDDMTLITIEHERLDVRGVL